MYRMSGGVVVGGENKVLMLKVKGESILVLLDEVIVIVRIAVDADPEHVAPVG